MTLKFQDLGRPTRRTRVRLKQIELTEDTVFSPGYMKDVKNYL